jgi:hypothetical protein
VTEPQRKWTEAERDELRQLRDTLGLPFAEIAKRIPNATESQCRAQYYVGRPLVLPSYVNYAPIEKLAEKIAQPGIDKHLLPLCLYKGTITFGRVHRWWNFALAAMEQGAATSTDIIKLSHHADYSHLAGPPKKVVSMGVMGFFSRLGLNPKVTDNVPGMSAWVREIMPTPFALRPVPLESQYRRRLAPWRIFIPRSNLNGGRRSKIEVGCYPYIAHDPKTLRNGGDLVMKVHAAVPKNLPEELRADICQDLVCAILAGEMKVDDLTSNIADLIRAGRKMFDTKWGQLSLNAVIPGTDGLTLMDTI